MNRQAIMRTGVSDSAAPATRVRPDPQAGFLGRFAKQRHVEEFAGINLPAGELPFAGVVPGRRRAAQHQAVAILAPDHHLDAGSETFEVHRSVYSELGGVADKSGDRRTGLDARLFRRRGGTRPYRQVRHGSRLFARPCTFERLRLVTSQAIAMVDQKGVVAE